MRRSLRAPFSVIAKTLANSVTDPAFHRVPVGIHLLKYLFHGKGGAPGSEMGAQYSRKDIADDGNDQERDLLITAARNQQAMTGGHI